MNWCSVDEVSLTVLVARFLSQYAFSARISMIILHAFLITGDFTDVIVSSFGFSSRFVTAAYICAVNADIRLPFLAHTVADGTTAGHSITVYAFVMKYYTVGHVLCNLLYNGSP
jgi:hypothetical protein